MEAVSEILIDKPIRLLIIDDDPDDRDIIKIFLKNYHNPLSIMEACNGKSGIELFRKNKFDCVFLDFMMPDINGYEVLRELLNIDQAIIVIALTGHIDKSFHKKMLNAGAADFLLKNTLNENILSKTLNYALERSLYIGEIIRQKKSIEKFSKELEYLVEIRTRELSEAKKIAEEKALQAENATRAKDDFLAIMSHEIRTPLNGIIGTLNIFQETKLDGKQEEMVKIMEKSSMALLSLINDILDFSKIGNGKLSLEEVNFNLRSIISDAIQIVQGRLYGKNIVLSLQIDSTIETNFLGDPYRIEQILLNLLSNSIKFTDSGEIKIIVENVSKNGVRYVLRISICDTGIGIDQESLKDIFEPFTQADNSISRKFGGSGLGLSIAKRLVEAMGGKIQAQSTPGKGSQFIFTIQLLHPDQNKNSASIEVSSIHSSRNKNLVRQKEKMKILVVEDDPISQYLIIEMLKILNHEGDAVSDGHEAIAMAKNNSYHLILMDCHLPTTDGFKVTQAIRKWEEATNKRKIPIVALTADITEKTRNLCKEAGMNDFLSKPIQIKMLEKALDKNIALETAIP